MNKKGQSDWFMKMSIVRLMIITVVILISLKLFVSHFASVDLDISTTRAEVLHSRIMYSPTINYVSDGRVHSGVIDISKLTNENLEEHIDYPSYLVAAMKITLYVDGEALREAYLNERRYKIWSPIASSELVGKGADIIRRSRKVPVTIRSEGTVRRGIMEIDVVVPR